MDSRERNRQKAFFYISGIITLAASLPGLDKLQYGNMLLDLIYRNMEWGGLLETQRAVKLKEQLLSALRKAVKMTKGNLSYSQKDFLEKVYPIAEKIFMDMEVWDMGEWERTLTRTVQKTWELEGEWHTPKEAGEITAVFMQCLHLAVTEYNELSNVILWGQTDALLARMDTMERKLDALERNTQTIPDIPHLLTASPVKLSGNAFLHRKGSMKAIERMLSQGRKAIMINGVGGIGKTTLVSAIYHKIKDNYRYAAWVSYDESLQKSFCNAFHLYMDQTDFEQKFRLIEGFLTNNRDLLLVIDNLDKGMAEDDSLKLLASLDVQIIVTSRQMALDGFDTYELPFLGEDSCVDVFYGYYGLDKERRQVGTVRELVRLAGRHTLLTELFAKTADTMGYRDLPLYLEELKAKGIGFSDLKITVGNNFEERTVWGHLNKLYELSAVTKEQQRILVFFSLMPDMLVPFKVREWMEFDINALEKLCRLGWLRKSEDGYGMPDIVKQTICTQGKMISEDDFSKIAGSTIFPCMVEIENETYEEQLMKMRIGDACVNAFYQGTVSEEAAVAYLCTGIAHQQVGNYHTAVKYLKKAVGMARQFWGKDDKDMGDFYNALAAAQYAAGECDAALKYFLKTADVRRKNLGKWNAQTAVVYCSLANVYRVKGDYKEAERYDRLALDIRTRLFGKNSEEIANSYVGIAEEYRIYGKYEQAMRFHGKALTIRKERLGEDHPDTLESYRCMAGVCKDMGRYEDALDYMKKAIVILERQKKGNHPAASIFYNDIAVIYGLMGEEDEALQYLERAGTIREKALGNNHPQMAYTYHNIGMQFLRKEDYHTALTYLERAFNIFKNASGVLEINLAANYQGRGHAYNRLSDYANALECFLQSAAIYERILPEKHTMLPTIYNNIGEVYIHLHNYEAADGYFAKALKIALEQLGEEELTVATIYVNIGLINYYRDEYKAASDYYMKAALIIQKLPQKPTQLIAYLLNNCAIIFIEGKEYSKAMHFLKLAEENNKEKYLEEIIKENMDYCDRHLKGE